jgi:hypothetical protein
MPKLHVEICIAAAITFVTAAAWAGDWSAWGRPKVLEVINEDAYRVIGIPLYNPKGCTYTDSYEIWPSATADARKLMNQTLMSAFLSGKEVRLYVSSTVCGATGRPAYAWIEIR